MNDDFFNESVPNGISRAIVEYDGSLECCGQDGYELLVITFGSQVCGNDLKYATDEDYKKFAIAMQSYFELSYLPLIDDVRIIIDQALMQWGG